MELLPGWNILEDGRRVFRVTTLYGTVMYHLDEKFIKEIFYDAVFLFLAKIEKLPTSFDEVEQMTGIDKSKYEDVEIELDNDDIFRETEQVVDISLKYHTDNVGSMFSDALQAYFDEALFKGLIERADAGHFIFHTTEMGVFKQMWKMRETNMKKRANVKKSSGADIYWTSGKRRKLVKFYERLLPEFREAKKAYKKLTWMKKEEDRQKTIREQYPDLPIPLLKQLEITGIRISPQHVTLEYLSPFFGNRSADAMLAVIRETQRENREKQTADINLTEDVEVKTS